MPFPEFQRGTSKERKASWSICTNEQASNYCVYVAKGSTVGSFNETFMCDSLWPVTPVPLICFGI